MSERAINCANFFKSLSALKIVRKKTNKQTRVMTDKTDDNFQMKLFTALKTKIVFIRNSRPIEKCKPMCLRVDFKQK